MNNDNASQFKSTQETMNVSTKVSTSISTNESTQKSKRYFTQEMAQIEVFGRIGKIFCKMSNLSTDGAFLEVISSNFMPKNKDLVRVTVQLRSIKKTYNLEAEVVWCKGLGIGLMFLNREQFQKKMTEKSIVQNA